MLFLWPEGGEDVAAALQLLDLKVGYPSYRWWLYVVVISGVRKVSESRSDTRRSRWYLIVWSILFVVALGWCRYVGRAGWFGWFDIIWFTFSGRKIACCKKPSKRRAPLGRIFIIICLEKSIRYVKEVWVDYASSHTSLIPSVPYSIGIFGWVCSWSRSWRLANDSLGCNLWFTCISIFYCPRMCSLD